VGAGVEADVEADVPSIRPALSCSTRARNGADVGAELTAWREALELLPPSAEQHQRIRALAAAAASVFRRSAYTSV
jgi:hypothetical protein